MTISALNFDHSVINSLPGDFSDAVGARQVMEACFSTVKPTPVRAPKLFAHAPEVAELLEWSFDRSDHEELASILSGNLLLPGMKSYASCYGGHQFGNWAGQLGDGRAITLGETLNSCGQRFELQLKGAGPTPYSRMGDGRAVLRSSIREFLCSEAMYHLGVPTTRALSLVTTGEEVVRDMFYDGHPRPEIGAIVCRVAPSFIRFGNFEIFARRGDVKNLKILADYTIRTYFSDLLPEANTEIGPLIYLKWLKEVTERTATLMVHWMRVGFVHGVMNTDNMSVLGLTIDYGPYGWLESYDPQWTPNTTDSYGKRYAYGKQPRVALWNIARFAEALYPLIGDVAPLEEILVEYSRILEGSMSVMITEKLGIKGYDAARDSELFEDLWALFGKFETDMTLFFRNLANVETAVDKKGSIEDNLLVEPMKDAFYDSTPFSKGGDASLILWLRRYVERVRQDGSVDLARKEAMNRVNPKYVLRNYLAQEAIDLAEAGDSRRVHELLEVMRHPYDEQPDKACFAAKRPDWARSRPGCSVLSCSS